MKKNVVTYKPLPMGEKHEKGLQKGLPQVGLAQGKGKCLVCKKKHRHWTVVEKEEEVIVKESVIPDRIQRNIIMCEREGCVGKPYRGNSACQSHYRNLK